MAKNLVSASSVTRYHGQLSSCTISEKTNDLILRKFSDGRTDGQTDRQKDRQTDRQMDESDFIGRCRTNVESPICIIYYYYLLFIIIYLMLTFVMYK